MKPELKTLAETVLSQVKLGPKDQQYLRVINVFLGPKLSPDLRALIQALAQGNAGPDQS